MKNVHLTIGIIAISFLLAGITNAQIENPRNPPPPPAPAPIVVEEGLEVEQPELIGFPDVEAQFPGGSAALKNYIQDNVIYPEVSIKNGDQGRVYVTFIVERDGSITGVDVMRGGVTQELNDEAKRLVRGMPLWKPGEVKNQAVRCRCRLPITFTLESDTESQESEKRRLFRGLR